MGQNYQKAAINFPVIHIYMLVLDFACLKLGLHSFIFASVGVKLG